MLNLKILFSILDNRLFDCRLKFWCIRCRLAKHTFVKVSNNNFFDSYFFWSDTLCFSRQIHLNLNFGFLNRKFFFWVDAYKIEFLPHPILSFSLKWVNSRPFWMSDKIFWLIVVHLNNFIIFKFQLLLSSAIIV